MKLKIATVIDVAERQLCCGCGACAYAAPEAIEMKDVIDHGVRPIVKTGHFRDESLKTALAVCPGVALQHDHDPAEGRDGALAELADGWGPVLEVWEGWIDDDEARFRGSSGGGVTALARHGIEDGGMAGVVHIAARPDVPYLNETVFSTNRKELARGSGSRYAPASPCDGLGMIEDADGPCVFVGKPCDVAAANKAAARNPALARNLGLTIGIFCAGTPSTEGTLKMMERLGVAEPDDLAELRYRGHGWPGEATSITHDGTENRLTYQQSWGEVLSAHAQWRCRICPDHTGEFADIAVGDPWYRDIEPGEPGRSLFIVRTQRGRDFLMAAKAAGHLVIEKVDPATLPASQPNLLKVRGNVWMRVWIMRLLGAAVPTYTNIPTRPFWFSQLSWREKLQSILGTAKRVFRRGLRERTPMRPTPATNPPRRASVQEERNEPPRVGKAGRMIGVTAGVALVGIVLVLFLRPGRAVGVLVAAMLLYPDFLRIPMGLAQMSASRLIALALLARMLCRAERIEYKWILADTIVIVIYLWTLLAAFITDAGHEQVVWSIGNGLDTALIYFVARFTLSRLEHRRDAVLPFCLILLWLGAIGFLESVTGWSPYQRLLQYNAWQWMDKGLEYRMGFVRARGGVIAPDLLRCLDVRRHGDDGLILVAFAAELVSPCRDIRRRCRRMQQSLERSAAFDHDLPGRLPLLLPHRVHQARAAGDFRARRVR